MAICLLVPMSSLSRLSARSLFPIQSSSGCLSSFLLFPPHRMSGELVKTARADCPLIKSFQFILIPSRLRSGCLMMCPTGCLPLCVSSLSSCLPCRFLIRSAHPSRPSPRRACRSSVLLSACSSRLACPVMLIRRACPSCLIRSFRLLSLRLLASPCLPAPPLVSSGGASLVSLSSRHASRLPPLRFACPLLGVLTVILNAVAMGTVGCGAFVPRFHKLHLLSIGVVRISSSARRPFFFYFLASPFLVSISVEMSGDLVDGGYFFLVGFLRGRVIFLPCLCYNLCRGDGDLRMGGIRASVL